MGRLARVHLLPSQYSEKVVLDTFPIATQELTEAQETLISSPPGGEDSTVVMIDHAVPFQRSAKVPVDFFPTATQLVAEKQATSLSRPPFSSPLGPD